MGKDGGRFFRRFLRAFDLPEEVDLSVPRFTILSNREFMAENHRGILQYEETVVRFMTTEGAVRIDGAALEMTEFGKERIFVQGVIHAVCFEDAIQCGNL